MDSSGVYICSYVEDRECHVEDEFGMECDFDGDVEVFYDPEVFAVWWECPLCHYWHEEGWEVD